MQSAPQDRRFSDAWASIQGNLREIRLDETLSTR